jgi:hypothetical protein
MKRTRLACVALILAFALAGCRKVSDDTSTVIAKIGPQKITEPQFHELINALVGDPVQAMELLTNEKNLGQRNEILERYVESKGIVLLAKEEGLDADTKVRLQLEEAAVQIYAQALLERRSSQAEPTEAQLREIYREIAAMRGGNLAGFPPFEEAKPHLPQLWKQKQQQDAQEALLKEIRTKFPMIIADGYKSMTS